MSQVAACWSWEGPDLPRMECISPRVRLSAAPGSLPHSSAHQQAHSAYQTGGSMTHQSTKEGLLPTGRRSRTGRCRTRQQKAALPLGSPRCPPPTNGSSPRPPGTQPHRLGGPFCRPLAPHGLLEVSAFPRDRLPVLVLAAHLDLPDVHPAVLAEGLPAVRQLGERGGWGKMRAVRGQAARLCGQPSTHKAT